MTSLTIDLAVYPLETVLRTCQAFTARCYVLARTAVDGHVIVDFTPRDERDSLRELAGEFSNALLDNRLRAIIANETHAIRELLVAQAFCEADLLDRREVEGSEYDDPRGIAS
ncbi:MAG TPA: His-Xaa-Ser system protein HxsD [Thermoanaerobaculia bacterium]|nr:His-Xaa-Ser system protein HxsD [Thermoanaerobaculia bacterium]